MIEWLSDRYSVNINAVVLNYIKTAGTKEQKMGTVLIIRKISNNQRDIKLKRTIFSL
jgi:hypothetical protein